jgi:hypothetical protein
MAVVDRISLEITVGHIWKVIFAQSIFTLSHKIISMSWSDQLVLCLFAGVNNGQLMMKISEKFPNGKFQKRFPET